MGIRVVRTLSCAVFFTFAFSTIALAQQNDAAELLKEVRLLRQTIETITSTNIRVQIVFGRLQMQEQRTVSATQRLEAARERHREVVEQIAFFDARAKEQAETPDTMRDQDQRDLAIAMKRESERYRSALETQRAQALADEMDAANCLALEQGQWSELSQRLEELERSLARRH